MDPVDDTRHYKFGIFYVNPEDKRRIVPKRMRPLGFTLNFAHKDAVFWVLVVLITIILLINVVEALL